MEEKLVHFLRTRDYVLMRELGQGACGKTVLLHDDQLDQFFVCKKYAPHAGLDRQALFQNFKREIKLLHDLNHVNVVRVFNYYLYPDAFSGYILMEHISGEDVDAYLVKNPEQTNEVFEQAITGFRHLELCSVLHRDIRPANLMVSGDGIVKIIDLGFGKKIQGAVDFDKSISLNWWCELPAEFSDDTYTFGTEVYFVGKLFEKMIVEGNIGHFKYSNVLKQMCARNPKDRINSFLDVERAIQSDLFYEIDFSDEEAVTYRYFADCVTKQLLSLERGKYVRDLDRLKTNLEAIHRSVMLEEKIPDASIVLSALVNGAYTYQKLGFRVDVLRNFIRLLKGTSIEKQRILLSNLHTRLDAIQPYKKRVATGFDDMDDEIPF